MSRQSPSAQEIKPFLVGVVNIQITPFQSDTEIDEAALRDNTRHMISRGLVTFKMARIAGRPMGDHELLPLVRPSDENHIFCRLTDRPDSCACRPINAGRSHRCGNWRV